VNQRQSTTECLQDRERSRVAANPEVAANTAARHTHANKAVLDGTTASFTTADETKLDGVAAGARDCPDFG